MKTSELTGHALDWAVGTAMKLPPPYWADGKCANFSTDWAQGGPIIEREGFELCRIESSAFGVEWRAQIDCDCRSYGPTPLIAAMRCYVASKLGDEVDVPEELLGDKA
jgi:hypothetical protein